MKQKNLTKRLLILAIFSIFVMLTPMTFGATNLSACGSINTPDYHTLTNNVSSNNNCFYVNTGDVTIDCGGYTIDGNNSGSFYGIIVSNNVDINITVKNCIIKGFGGAGLLSQNTSGVFLYNNTFLDNGFSYSTAQHINLGASTQDFQKSNLRIIGNTIDNDGNNGNCIGIQDWRDIVISDNQFINITNGVNQQCIGISNWNASGSYGNITIENNNFTDVMFNASAILIGNSAYPYHWDNVVVRGNRQVNTVNLSVFTKGASFFAMAFWSSDSFSNVLIENNYMENVLGGIETTTCNNCTIRNNIVNQTPKTTDGSYDGWDISLRGANNSQVYNNTIIDSRYCMRSRQSSNSVFYDNICERGEYGFDLRDSTNITFRNNDFSNDLDRTQPVGAYGVGFGLRLRGTSPDAKIYNNTLNNNNLSLLFRSGGTFVNTKIKDNNITNSYIAVDFTDATITNLEMTHNNIYNNTITFKSEVSRVVSGNYYGSGYVYSNGTCYYQPFTEGNVTDYNSYCCISGWVSGCSQLLPQSTPTVVIVSPPNNTKSSSNPTINYITTDADNSTLSCSLYMDGSVNLTNTSVSNNTLSGFHPYLTNGYHVYYINCSDGTNIGISATQNFYLDSTEPLITLPDVDGNIYTSITEQPLPFYVKDAGNDTLNCSMYVDLDSHPFDQSPVDSVLNINNTATWQPITLVVNATSIYSPPSTLVYFGVQCTDGVSVVNSTVLSVTFKELFTYESNDLPSAFIDLVVKIILTVGSLIAVLIMVLLVLFLSKNIKKKD